MNISACIFLLSAIIAAGQDISFSVTADRTMVSLGERIQVTAQVVSNKKLSGSFTPQVPKNDNFDVLGMNRNSNQSTSIQVINGKMTQSVNITYFFYYSIAPKKTGSFTFPVISCLIDGVTYTSNPFTITVGKEPVQTSDVRFSLQCNKRTLCAGEQAILTVQIALKAQAQVTQQGFSQSLDRI
jgi:hypothetical protein